MELSEVCRLSKPWAQAMTGWRTLGCFLLVQGACLWLWTSRCSVPQRAVPVESSNGLHSLPKEPSESTAAATESEESTESEAAESEGSEESTESETSEERSEDLAPEASLGCSYLSLKHGGLTCDRVSSSRTLGPRPYLS